MDGGGTQGVQGGVVGVEVGDQFSLGRPVAVQMAEGMARDLMAASDQIADLAAVGKAAHVSVLPEQADADIEGSPRVMRLQRLGPGVSGAGGDVVEGEADGRSGQAQARRAPVRQSGEAAAQLALQADVRRVRLDHIASA